MKKKSSLSAFDYGITADSDLRPDLAAQHETLLMCGQGLDRTDRAIWKLVSCGQYTRAEVAALLGISLSSLSYHIARLKKILRHDFRVALVPSGPRSTEEQKVARIAYLKDRTLKTIASETGLSLYRVRKITANRKQKVN